MNLIKVNTMPAIFNTMDDIIDGFVDSYRYDQARIPKYNVIENEKEYIVTVEIPGFEKEDVSIEHKDDILTISGTSKYSEKSERYFNSFENLEINKSFYLPEDVETKKIDANLKNGILAITIPRKTPIKTKAKKITIK
tara:strand:+ start:208 stop:621 length:414 start_codon:yes stop_codon:yes gene_type:complete